MKADIFAGNDLGLAGLAVEDLVIQGTALVKNIEQALGGLTDGDAGIAQGIRRPRGLDLVKHLVVLQGQVFREAAGFLVGKDMVELGLGKELWAMGIVVAARLDGKAAVVILDEIGSELIGGLDGVDVSLAML